MTEETLVMDRSSDPADIASSVEEIERAAALQAARDEANKKPILATGECLECGEEVGEGVRWCSPECRDDWEKAQRIKAQRGH